MSTARWMSIIVWCTAFTAMADTGISLSGIVIDTKGSAITGAAVSLASDSSATATTGIDGQFTIGPHAATNRFPVSGSIMKNAALVDIRGNRLQFTVTSSVSTGDVVIFSNDGKKQAEMQLVKMAPGIHTYSLPRLIPGFYILHITIDHTLSIGALVSTGGTLFLTGNISAPQRTARTAFTGATAGGPDSLVAKKNGCVTAKTAITSSRQSGITIMMEAVKSTVLAVKDLPVIKEMPDPLTMNDGTKVTTLDQWRDRRREMVQILEDYEYGHMPPPPGNVKATVTTALTRVTASGKQADYRMLHLTFGPNEKCGFDLGLFTPVTSTEAVQRFPVLIYLGYSAPSKSSLGDASAALARGYAVATMNYSQLGADATSWKSTAFFPSYPDYDWRDFSAWAWGISRAVDYLVTDSTIDKDKIMATGVSRCGQPVLLAGAFDERIALSAPVAGGMALRFSGKEMGGGLGQGINEVVDQGTYWFGPLLEKFKSQTPKLPCDQHWLPALTAPRLFIMCNSFKDEYGRAYAAVQTYLGAKPVYELLKADENLGMSFRAGGHGMTADDWSALLDFADQNLLKKGGTRKFNVIPPASQTP